MKLKLLSAFILASLACISAARATVTIVFNAPFAGGMSSNLANTAGVVSNGMKWGILVDTNGNGISATYDLVSLTAGASFTLTNSGTSSGDRLIMANDTTSESSQGGLAWEVDFATPGGDGGVSGILFALGNGVATGQSFWLVWFDETTHMAGTLASSQFLVPPDGQTVSYDEVFLGLDPVRPATDLFFTEASPGTDSIIPEPSSALLGILGAIALLRRRR